MFSFIHPAISGYDHSEYKKILIIQTKKFIRPNWEYPFGTDDGRPMFDMVWAGARTSLTISFTVTIITMTVGIIVGMFWGFNKSLDFLLP